MCVNNNATLIELPDPNNQIYVNVLNQRNRKSIGKRHAVVTGDKIKKIFGDILNLHVNKIFPIYDGRGQPVFKIICNNSKSYILKIDLFSDHHSVIHEYFFIKSIGNYLGLLPKVYLLDLSNKLIPLNYAVYEYKIGQSVLSYLEEGVNNIRIYDLIEQVALLTKTIHNSKINVKGFGKLDLSRMNIYSCLKKGNSNFDYLVGQFSSAKIYYFTQLNYNLQVLKGNRLVSLTLLNDTLNLVRDLFVCYKEIFVLHGDLTLRNFLTDGRDITAVIDGSAHLGSKIQEMADFFTMLILLDRHLNNFSLKKGFKIFQQAYGNSLLSTDEYNLFICFVISKIVSKIESASRFGFRGETDIYLSVFENIIHSKGYFLLS